MCVQVGSCVARWGQMWTSGVWCGQVQSNVAIWGQVLLDELGMVTLGQVGLGVATWGHVRLGVGRCGVQSPL